MIRNIAMAALAAACLGLPASAQTVPDFSGVWLLQGDHAVVKTLDGKTPPLTREGARKYRQTQAAFRAGNFEADSVASCLPHGLPRLLFAGRPIEVLQEEKQITFVHETQHMPRLVYIGDELPSLDDLDQNWMGFSAGRWEGDALVVDSAGFNDQTTVDKSGLPRSVEMKINERIRRVDADTLENVITVTDPKMYSRPWSTRVVFKKTPGVRLGEYVCTDQNPEARP